MIREAERIFDGTEACKTCDKPYRQHGTPNDPTLRTPDEPVYCPWKDDLIIRRTWQETFG